jgi:Holliday junction resolvase RusA-like endonuclease
VTQPLVRLNDYALHGKAALSGLGEQRVAPVGGRQTVVLPAPPSANRYWRKWKGRMVKSKEARAYRTAVMARLPVVCRLEGPVAWEVRWSRSKRMGDLGNRLKVLEDALNGLAWIDDKQICEQHAYRSEGGDDTVCVTWWAA